MAGHEHGGKMLPNFLAASAGDTGVLGSVQRGRKLSPSTGVLPCLLIVAITQSRRLDVTLHDCGKTEENLQP